MSNNDHLNREHFYLKDALKHALLIFLLQIAQAVNTQAAIIQFSYILYLVNSELYGSALAFSVRIGLALKSRATAVAVDGFVLLISNRHDTKIKSPEVTYFRA
jgi:hypothetical protein